MMMRLSAAIAIVGLTSSQTNAEEIDLNAALKSALWKNRTSIPWPLGQFQCFPDGRMIAKLPLGTINAGCAVTFENLRVKDVKVDYSTVAQSPIPDSIARDAFLYRNCGDDPLPIQDNLSLSYTESSTISNSTTLQSGSTSTVGASITIPIQAVSLGLNAQHSVNFSRSSTDTNQTSSQTTKTLSQAINFTVAPMTVHEVVLEKRLKSGYLQFSGNVELDAEVYIQPTQGSGPRLHVGKLSVLQPSQSDRTVVIKGEIWNVKGQDTARSDKIDALTPEVCGTTTTTIQKPTFSARGAKVLKGITLRPPGFSAVLPVSSGVVLTTQPLTNGMTITTSNSVANVSVRMKSLGPGFCAVGVTGGPGSVNVLAPPFSWSPWTVLFSHIGQTTATISTNIGCDTGALFEIQYYKDI